MSDMTQADNMTRAEREALREAIIAGREREKRIAADREHRDRRERIATAALAALLTRNMLDGSYQTTAQKAVMYANALIAELDKKEDKP